MNPLIQGSKIKMNTEFRLSLVGGVAASLAVGSSVAAIGTVAITAFVANKLFPITCCSYRNQKKCLAFSALALGAGTSALLSGVGLSILFPVAVSLTISSGLRSFSNKMKVRLKENEVFSGSFDKDMNPQKGTITKKTPPSNWHYFTRPGGPSSTPDINWEKGNFTLEGGNRKWEVEMKGYSSDEGFPAELFEPLYRFLENSVMERI
jgi:hypothetical protein